LQALLHEFKDCFVLNPKKPWTTSMGEQHVIEIVPWRSALEGEALSNVAAAGGGGDEAGRADAAKRDYVELPLGA
jgi:hypothetical protein